MGTKRSFAERSGAKYGKNASQVFFLLFRVIGPETKPRVYKAWCHWKE